nr:hypothetical protein Iba_chr07eCG8390 [Ipomoea batatas]
MVGNSRTMTSLLLDKLFMSDVIFSKRESLSNISLSNSNTISRHPVYLQMVNFLIRHASCHHFMLDIRVFKFQKIQFHIPHPFWLWKYKPLSMFDIPSSKITKFDPVEPDIPMSACSSMAGAEVKFFEDSSGSLGMSRVSLASSSEALSVSSELILSDGLE